MSSNNVMDVFLAVKVDQDESDDLAGLLDTLQRISALQSSFTATGGIDLNIDVNTKDVENKIDELKKFLEEDFEQGDTKTILDIKSNTDYIISRLWSVSSPTASPQQIVARFQGIGGSSSEIMSNYMAELKDTQALKTVFGSATKGRSEMENLVKFMADKISYEIATDTATQETLRGIKLIERIVNKESALNRQTINAMIKWAGGGELSLQKDITGMKGGDIRTEDGFTTGSQLGFYSRIAGAGSRTEFETMIGKTASDPIGRLKEFKPFEKKIREKIAQVNLNKGTTSSSDLQILFDQALGDWNPTEEVLGFGQIMPNIEEWKKMFKDKVMDAFAGSPEKGKLYLEQYKMVYPDEVQQLTNDLLKVWLDPKQGEAPFRKGLTDTMKKIYKNPKYVQAVVNNFVEELKLYTDDEIEQMESLTIMQEWKILKVLARDYAEGRKKYLAGVIKGGIYGKASEGGKDEGMGIPKGLDADALKFLEEYILPETGRDDAKTQMIAQTMRLTTGRLTKDDLEKFKTDMSDLIKVVIDNQVEEFDDAKGEGL